MQRQQSRLLKPRLSHLQLKTTMRRSSNSCWIRMTKRQRKMKVPNSMELMLRLRK